MGKRASAISLLAVLLIAPFVPYQTTFNEKVGSENMEHKTWLVEVPTEPIGAEQKNTSPALTSPTISASASVMVKSLKRNERRDQSGSVPPSKPLASIKPSPKPKPSSPPIRKTPALASQVKVWNRSKASQYGGADGFYYNHFACGGTYYPNVVGVAHKFIKCGTLIEFKHFDIASQTWKYARIRVVDRGPYCCGRDWDFTVKAAQELGFHGIGVVYWRYTR